MKKQLSLIHRYYNVLIAILAIISIILVILDYSGLILLSRYPYDIIDNSILIIFAIDYFARLFKSPDKLTFVKQNVFDLLAIIPFASIFSFFRFARVFRVMRITRAFRLTRLVGVFSIFQRRAKRFLHSGC